LAVACECSLATHWYCSVDEDFATFRDECRAAAACVGGRTRIRGVSDTDADNRFVHDNANVCNR
jgi:hypothetical protein